MLFLFKAMVARGDLGAELPIEEVPLLQVLFLSKSNANNVIHCQGILFMTFKSMTKCRKR